MKLIPIPKVLRQFSEIVKKRAVFCDCKNIDDRLVKAIHKLPNNEFGLALTFHIGNGTEESYVMDINNDGIVIETPSVVGAFYAVQTLRQILENETVYACHIEDAPDFGFRGFYHDVTRGRIPTLW